MNVLMPETLSEACQMLAAHGPGVVPLAGATDLLVHWPVRPAEHDRTYLDLSNVAELRALAWSDSALTLGAMTTYWDVIQDARAAAEFPLLIDAGRQVGSLQIQSRGTWAGNIANGSPAADGVPVLMAYDAVVTLVSSTGTRAVPLCDFYTGYRKSVRRADELISAITLPRRPFALGVFHKVGPRRAQAISKVGVAVTCAAGGGSGAWRVVANSVAETVRRCRAVERVLEGGPRVKTPDDFLAAVSADVAPIDDIRSTAEYRRTVLCRILYHSLKGQCPWVV
ncbi:MAG: FAD binding domain-containing protein [Phycisphaerales bacterium]